MPVTYYTEEEVQEYTRLLAECYRHIAEGSATDLAQQSMLNKIARACGWTQNPNPTYDGSYGLIQD